MNIYEIEIINDKHIKCFRKQLNGENLVVAGDTGTGKTTSISGLWEEVIKKCPDALSHGAKKGSHRIKLSDGSDRFVIATRTTTNKSSTITITDQDGKPVAMADFKKMLSSLSVNPHRIIDMKPTEQVRTLAAAADLGDIDLDRMDFAIKQAEENRLDLFREIEILAPGAEPEKVDAVDVSALVAEKTFADQENYKLNNRTDNLQRMVEQGIAANDEIERLGKELKAKMTARDELRKRAEELQAVVVDTKPMPTDALVEQIANAQTTNDAAAAHRNWLTSKERHDAKTNEHAASDAKVKELREQKKSALDAAKWPIDGLSIEDGEIIYNGCLLSNLGTSEQILVCSAIAKKDILAHDIHVVRIDGIEAMSPGDKGKLFDLFNADGIQVLATRVTWGETMADEIVIEEGVYSD